MGLLMSVVSIASRRFLAPLLAVGAMLAGYPSSAGPHPAIEFSSVPNLGSFEDLAGRVSNVTFSDYRVAVYIKVGGSWWTKPTFVDPLSTIEEDGTWRTDITTGGSDEVATEIVAYLVPAGFDPVDTAGAAALPSDVQHVSISSVRCTRTPTATPEIRFTDVPALNSMVDLVGAVEGVDLNSHRVAVYIFAFQGWYNKPVNPPDSLTPIGSSGSWVTDITTGGADPCAWRIAAFLVPNSFVPSAANGAAEIPGDVQAAALAAVETTRFRRLSFSGYEWFVKDSCESTAGPGPNVFSSSTNNVWVDTEGRLHLKIEFRDGKWRNAEIRSERSFGYGTYRIYVDTDTGELDSNVTLGLFTWSNDEAYTHREIDFEAGRWRNPSDANNAQFVVQPFDNPGNMIRFQTPPGQTKMTHQFIWQSNRIDFLSFDGHYDIVPTANLVWYQWSFLQTPEVPRAGGEHFLMNLWQVLGVPPAGDGVLEVVISRFAFIPPEVPEPVIGSAGLTPAGDFEFTFEGVTQVEYQIQAASNLVTELEWFPLGNVIVTNSTMSVLDPDTSSHRARAYRLVAPPQ
jgi:hypothetical protein